MPPINRRQSEYKPLLFTTTVRNPERMKGFLHILKNFNEQILSDDLARTIMGELIRFGLYRPTKSVSAEIQSKWGAKNISPKSQVGLRLLSDQEVLKLLEDNPQKHKEAGFAKGWPSRFSTVFDFAKELGFVYFWPGEKIQFSEIGSKLAGAVDIRTDNGNIYFSEVHPEFERQSFLHALTKYQRNNPFTKVLNENAPLILLLEVIGKLNQDPAFNGAGISKWELPLIIFWKDANAQALYELIKELRKKHGYSPSWEVIVDVCVNGIMGGTFKKFKPKSIMAEYPDEFIRKMRLTGLISLRGGGRFLDVNKKEQTTVDYILKTYSGYKKYATEKEYFSYVSAIDEKLLPIKLPVPTLAESEKYLMKWLKIYSWPQICAELMNLALCRLTKDEVLKYLSNPVRLEFLAALAVKSKFPDISVLPNYPTDDEGLPTSTAGGVDDMGDIECFEKDNGVLIEVTMSQGRTQTVMEVWPITRHLEKLREKTKNVMCYFIAPSIFIDSARQINFVKREENLSIVPKSIKEFIDFLNAQTVLYHPETAL